MKTKDKLKNKTGKERSKIKANDIVAAIKALRKGKRPK